MNRYEQDGIDTRTAMILVQVAFKEANEDLRRGFQADQEMRVADLTVEKFNALIDAMQQVGIIEVVEPEVQAPTIRTRGYGQ